MELLDYEETLRELSSMGNIKLNTIQELEVDLENASISDIAELYKSLEETKKSLRKLKEILV